MILLAFIFLLILAVISKVNLYKDGFEVQSKIPKIIMQTYIDRDKVPQKVFDNIKKYAPEYEYLFFNNEGCLRFLKEKNYHQKCYFLIDFDETRNAFFPPHF